MPRFFNKYQACAGAVGASAVRGIVYWTRTRPPPPSLPVLILIPLLALFRHIKLNGLLMDSQAAFGRNMKTVPEISPFICLYADDATVAGKNQEDNEIPSLLSPCLRVFR